MGLAIMFMPLLAISLSNITSEGIINANSLSLAVRTLTANVSIALSLVAYKHLLLENHAQFVAETDSLTSAKYSEPGARAALEILNHELSTDALQTVFVTGGVLLLLGTLVMVPAASRFAASTKSTA